MDPSPLRLALSNAPLRAPTESLVADEEFFCVRLGDLELGVPSSSVREVLRAGPLTPLPRMPGYVLGVCGHRGEVLPVLDMLRFLGKGEARVGTRTRLFVGITQGSAAAFVTDAILGLNRFATADILPPPTGGDPASEHVLGVVRRSGAQAMTLLNLAKLLASARQQAVRKMIAGTDEVEVMVFEVGGKRFAADASQVLQIGRASKDTWQVPSLGALTQGHRTIVFSSATGPREVKVDVVHGVRSASVSALRRMPVGAGAPPYALGLWLDGAVRLVLVDFFSCCPLRHLHLTLDETLTDAQERLP